MTRSLRWMPWFAVLAALGGASQSTPSGSPAAAVQPQAARCEMAAATPWIEKWLGAWELASRRILRIADAPPPEIVLYDSACVYTTSEAAAGGAAPVKGPTLHGTALPWHAFAHQGSITLPDRSEVSIQLMSFANSAKETGPFFVMAAPSYWAERSIADGGLFGVFLHEFTHTRQIGGIGRRIGPIDDSWPYPEELDDDAVQTHFKDDPEYVAAYTTERDLLYRAAAAIEPSEVCVLATEALATLYAAWRDPSHAVQAAEWDRKLRELPIQALSTNAK